MPRSGRGPAQGEAAVHRGAQAGTAGGGRRRRGGVQLQRDVVQPRVLVCQLGVLLDEPGVTEMV